MPLVLTLGSLSWYARGAEFAQRLLQQLWKLAQLVLGHAGGQRARPVKQHSPSAEADESDSESSGGSSPAHRRLASSGGARPSTRVAEPTRSSSRLAGAAPGTAPSREHKKKQGVPAPGVLQCCCVMLLLSSSSQVSHSTCLERAETDCVACLADTAIAAGLLCIAASLCRMLLAHSLALEGGAWLTDCALHVLWL